MVEQRRNGRILGCLALGLVLGLAACGVSAGSDRVGEPASSETATTTTTEDLFADVGDIDRQAPATSTKAEYVAALAADLQGGDPANGDVIADRGQAECVAEAWVDAITVERLRAAGVSADDVGDDLDFDALDIGEAAAQQILDGFEACEYDLAAGVVDGLTADLSPEEQACAHDRVDRDLVDAVFLAGFAGASDDEVDAAFEAVFDQLTKACDLPPD